MDNSSFTFPSFHAAIDDEPAVPMAHISNMTTGLAGHPDIPPELIQFAKRIKAIRESRAALLDASLFGEPAWNILLALYVAAGERYALAISALCAESGAPHSTAARSINRLLELDMVRRVPNPSDNRSTYIELTRETAEKLTELLDMARSKYLAD